MYHTRKGALASLLEALQQENSAKASREATLKRAPLRRMVSCPPRLKPGAKRSLLKPG